MILVFIFVAAHTLGLPCHEFSFLILLQSLNKRRKRIKVPLRLEPVTEADSAECGAVILAFEFFGAVDERIADPVLVIGEGKTGIGIGHEIFLVHAVRIAESVAIQKDVSSHRAPLHSGEKIPTPFLDRDFEEPSAGQAGPHTYRSVLPFFGFWGKAEVDAHIGKSVNIAHGRAIIRCSSQ